MELKAEVLESGAGRSCCPYDYNIERYGDYVDFVESKSLRGAASRSI
jgi:hypothetical protein